MGRLEPLGRSTMSSRAGRVLTALFMLAMLMLAGCGGSGAQEQGDSEAKEKVAAEPAPWPETTAIPSSLARADAAKAAAANHEMTLEDLAGCRTRT